MKRLFFCGMLVIQAYAQAQTFFQNEISISTTGTTHEYVADVDYNPDYDQYKSLHKTSRGMAVFTYDGTANFPVPLAIYKSSGLAFYPVRIIDNANLTHILFYGVVSGQKRYAVIQYDNSTNVINWVKALSNSSNSIYCEPKDMDVDINTGDVYITGDQMDIITGALDIFAAKINNSGSLQWHYRYDIAGRDEYAFSVFFHSSTEIYLGAMSDGPSSALDKKALVIQINNLGTVVNEIDLQYTTANNCNYNRIGSASVKRTGNDIFVFIPSYAGSDGAGCFSLFKLDPTLNVTDFNMYAAGLNFYDPLFELTDNNNNISICGHRRIMGPTSNLGYTTYNISTAGFYNMGGWRYPNTEHNFWGPDLIRTVYNSYTNELVAVMDYYPYPDRFHLIKSDAYGQTFTDCDEKIDLNLCKCVYTLGDPNVGQIGIPTTFNTISNVFLSALSESDNKICESDICLNCKKVSGIHQLSDSNPGITIHPNPVSTIITVNSSSAFQKIEVLDMMGKVLICKNVTGLQDIVDLSGVETGVYLLRITGTGNSITLKKIIKN